MVQHGLVPDEAAPQEPLAGGYVSAVVRVADTVRRNPGPNADFVRRLLGLFEQAGFDGAPRYLGTDAQGREILSFVDGHVPWHAALQPNARTDASLESAARLLRRCHDLTAGTALARESEVVCHNDLSPRNTVYRDHGSFPPQAKPRIGWTGPADNRPDPRWSRPTCPSTGCEPPPGSRPHR